MDAKKILQSDVLDLIFEGRNKEYGAYMLRRNYNKRLLTSIGITLLLCLVFMLTAFRKSSAPTEPFKPAIVPFVLDPYTPPEEVLPPKPPAPPAAPQEIATIRNTIPQIISDEEVKPDEMPPDIDDLESRKIAAFTREGTENIDFVTPPAAEAIEKGIIEGPPAPRATEEKIYIKVEKESEYPGGINAWKRFLQRNMVFPEYAKDNEIQGTVVVQFIVDAQGNVSHVAAISGPEELRAEAVRVISKSGKWTPALQNGQNVKSYKRQPIVFRMEL